MINHFLAKLDNNPVAPTEWPWPTFTAKARGVDEKTWYDLVIGTGLAREHSFRRCLALDAVVSSSSLAGYRRAVDPRITYTNQDVRDRLNAYGWIINSSVGAGVASPVFSPLAPAYLLSTVTATGTNTVTVAPAVGLPFIANVTFSGGNSNAISLVSDGSASITISGSSLTIGQTWTVQRSVWENDYARAIAVVNQLKIPTWLPPDLLSAYNSFTRDTERVAAVICGFAT